MLLKSFNFVVVKNEHNQASQWLRLNDFDDVSKLKDNLILLSECFMFFKSRVSFNGRVGATSAVYNAVILEYLNA